jgi:hypothetical protein
LLEPDDHGEAPDIFKIVKACLQDVKKLKSACSLKVVTQLTAVLEYAKLQDQYQCHNKCKRPGLSVSLAIARRMEKGRVGKKKGSYFACQIHRNEAYLLKHKCLPPTKAGAKHGQHTLLDNEAVLHGVRRYLAAQNLGTITPKLFCHHVNNTILPALDLTRKMPASVNKQQLTGLKSLATLVKMSRKGFTMMDTNTQMLSKPAKNSWSRLLNTNGKHLKFYQITTH